MPTTAKTRRPSSRSKSTNGSAPKRRTQAEPPASHGGLTDRLPDLPRSIATIAKGTAAAAAGTAVAAVAGRAVLAGRSRRRRVLGVPMPRRNSGMKGVAKRVAGVAGDLEKHSLDVSKASGRAKEAAKLLS